MRAKIDAVLWWSLILFCVALPLAWELGGATLSRR